jgi:hypothetical protein
MYINYGNDRKLLVTELRNPSILSKFQTLKYKLSKLRYGGYFFFAITTAVLPTVGPAFSVLLPVPQQIVRIQADQNKLTSSISQVKLKYGIASSDIPSRDKIFLNQSELDKVELIVKQYRLELVTLDDVVLEFRGGQDSSNWVMFFAFLYLLQYYTESAFTVPPFLDPLNYIGRTTPKFTGASASDSCYRHYPFEQVYMEGKKQTISSEADEYLSMNDRHL